MGDSQQNKTLVRVLIVMCIVAAIAVIIAAILAFTTCSSDQDDVIEVEQVEELAPSTLPNTLLVEPTNNAPTLEILYPDGWEPYYQVNSPDVTGLTPGSVSASVNDGKAYVQLLYQAFDGDPYDTFFDQMATVTKVADARFDSSGGSALGPTDAGPFMVAEVEYSNIDDSPGKTNMMLALLPASFEGQHRVSVIQATSMMPFMYAGQAVYLYCKNSNELSASQREEVIEIMASMEAAR